MQSRTLAISISSLVDNPNSKLYGNKTFLNKLEYGNFTKTEWEIINQEYCRFFCSLDVFDTAMTTESIASQIHYLILAKKPNQTEIVQLRQQVDAEAKELGKTRIDDIKQRLFLKKLKSWKRVKTRTSTFNKIEFIGKTLTMLTLCEKLDNGQHFYYFAKVLAEYVYPQIIQRVWDGKYKPRRVNFKQDLQRIRDLGLLLMEADASREDIESFILDLDLTIGRLDKSKGRQSVFKYVNIVKQCPPITNLD